MAHALSITDGTTTVSLSTDNFMLLQYVPNVPAYRNGTYDPVIESIELNAYGSSSAAAMNAIHSVTKLLDAAVRRQETKVGDRIYLTLTLDGGSAKRSEVLDGSVVFGADSLRSFGGANIECSLILTRVPYWEGALVQLIEDVTLTNADGSNGTYTTATITGVMPAPVKFTLENPSGSTQYPSNIFLGCNVFGSAFDGTFATKSFTWSAPRTFESSWVATWTPSSAELAALGSREWRVLVAFTGGATADTFYRMQWVYGAVNEIAMTDEAYMTTGVDDDVVDLGSMAIPNIGDPDMGGLTLELVVATEDADGDDVLAFVQFMPADNCRWLDAFGTLAPGEEIVDDGIEGYSYVTDGSLRYPQIYADGDPLMVYPGETHRFAWLYSANGYTSTTTTVLNVWYRPRWLTVS